MLTLAKCFFSGKNTSEAWGPHNHQGVIFSFLKISMLVILRKNRIDLLNPVETLKFWEKWRKKEGKSEKVFGYIDATWPPPIPSPPPFINLGMETMLAVAHAHTHARTQTCLYRHTFTHTHTHMYIRKHTHTQVLLHVCFSWNQERFSFATLPFVFSSLWCSDAFRLRRTKTIHEWSYCFFLLVFLNSFFCDIKW